MATEPKPEGTRLQRTGRRLRAFEDSLETSVTPWVVLTAFAGLGGLVMVAFWAITGDWPEELR